MYKKLSSKTVLKHPRIIVAEDIIELENGEKTDYVRFANFPDSAAIIAVADNKILFLKEYSYLPNKLMLQLPGGRIENNEKPEQAAKRELKEETGYIAKNTRVIGSYYQFHRRTNAKVHVALASNLSLSEVEHESEELGTENVWIPVDEIRGLISSGQINDSDSLASLMIYGI